MNDTVKIVIIVVALAAAGVLIFRSLGGDSSTSREGAHAAHFICSNPKCNAEFEVRPGQKTNAPADSLTEVCPECGTDYPIKAAQCPSCGKLTPLIGHGVIPEACAECGAKLDRPSEKTD